MRYDNSLTSNVQNYIESTLAKKLSAAQKYWEVSGTARNVHSYLCDPTTINTPDFVIRRYIQAKHKELLPPKNDLPNLSRSNNVPWEPKTLDFLAEKLFKLSGDRGTDISKAEWMRYLSGKNASQREKVLQIAFTLDMDVDTTIDLFLAFDMEAYSVRYPVDLLALFCQKTLGTYTWLDVTSMLDEFEKRTAGEYEPTSDEINKIVSALKFIFTKSDLINLLPQKPQKPSIEGAILLSTIAGLLPKQGNTTIFTLSQALKMNRLSPVNKNMVANSGLDCKAFWDALIDSYKLLEYGEQKDIDDYNSFKVEVSTDKWLTFEVLTNTLKTLAKADREKNLIEQGFAAEQVYTIQKMAAAIESATSGATLISFLQDNIIELNNYCDAAKHQMMIDLAHEVFLLKDKTPVDIIKAFVLDRQHELLPKGTDITDFINKPIAEWNAESKNMLLAALERQSQKQHVRISATKWMQYLEGKPTTSRKMAFMLAFALQLDVSATSALLQGFKMHTYSVDPLDIICLFCQSRDEWYCWSNVENMIKEFEQCDSFSKSQTTKPSEDMTRQIRSKLDGIFEDDRAEADKKKEMIDYMVDHCNEFPKFPTNKATPYLPGYSLSKMGMFVRLAEYLAILYPEYRISNNDSSKSDTIKIEYHTDGIPKLSFLVRAAFQGCNWSRESLGGKQNNALINSIQYISADEMAKKWDVTEKRMIKYCKQGRVPNAIQRKDSWLIPANAKKPSEFEDRMYILCHNYEKHMMAIDRLLKDGNSVAFFERRDALLFIYFLINGYLKLIFDNTGDEANNAFEAIDDMLNSGDDFDYAIAEALEKAEYVFQNSDDENLISERFSSLLESFNLILTQLDYTNIYLPARFDRFVVLALLSATPDELTPLIMCQEELEYYESQN